MNIDELTPQIRLHQRALTLLAYRMTGDMALAEDITQEVFMKSLERVDTLHAPDDLRKWLVTLTINASRDALRHRKSRAYTGPWLPSPLPTESLPDEHHPEDCLLGKEALNYQLLLLCESLTANQRATLLLRDLCGYSTAECAEALGLTASNIKTTLHRARAALGPTRDRLWQAPTASQQQEHMAWIGQMMQALMSHDAEQVMELCAQDVVMYNDGGGEFIAALRPVRSAAHVTRFLLARAPRPEQIVSVDLVEYNGYQAIRAQIIPESERFASTFIMWFDLAHDPTTQTVKLVHCHMVSATAKLSACDIP